MKENKISWKIYNEDKEFVVETFDKEVVKGFVSMGYYTERIEVTKNE